MRASDIYSFGVVLYEMLTGRVPFEAETPWMAIHQHIYETPPPIRQLNPVVSEAVAQVVDKALAKDPKERYQHVEDLVQAFTAAQKPASAAVATVRPRQSRTLCLLPKRGSEQYPCSIGPEAVSLYWFWPRSF